MIQIPPYVSAGALVYLRSGAMTTTTPRQTE